MYNFTLVSLRSPATTYLFFVFVPQKSRMSSLSADRKTPLDYGVQIRFIKDLDDAGGGFPDMSRLAGGVVSNGTSSPSKYGVAVRVQGISGQPYVVLQDGEKGDSYGVQLKTQQTQSSTPIVSRSSPYSSLFPELREGARTPQDLTTSVVSSPDEEFGSPLKRPPGDGQAGNQGEGDTRTIERLAPSTPAPKVENKNNDCYNEAGLRKVKQNGGVCSLNGMGLNGSLDEEPAQAIDTKSLAPINKLISRFGGGGSTDSPISEARSRPRIDNRVRSQSVDALNNPNDEQPPPPTSPTINPYGPITSASVPKLSSVKPLTSSLGRESTTVAKVSAIPNSKPLAFNQSPKLFVPKETPPAIPKKPVSYEYLTFSISSCFFKTWYVSDNVNA